MDSPQAKLSDLNEVLSEQELLALMKSNNIFAFAVLYERYKDDLYFYTLFLTKSHYFAEEIVQETFTRLWEYREKANEQLSPKGYLFKIAKNLVLNSIRQDAVNTKAVKELKRKQAFSHNNTEDELLFSDYQRVALQAIEQVVVQDKVMS